MGIPLVPTSADADMEDYYSDGFIARANPKGPS